MKQLTVCPRCQSDEISQELTGWDAVLQVEKIQRVWHCSNCGLTFETPEELLVADDDPFPVNKPIAIAICGCCGDEIPVDEANEGGSLGYGVLCNDCYAERISGIGLEED